MKRLCLIGGWLVAAGACFAPPSPEASPAGPAIPAGVVPPGLVLVVDGASPGRTFEGIGGLSAGASSRLLLDYPEPQRRRVLDYLFKPNFGAAFHHLKVEIGGDVNSAVGTEPSFARTREEFERPRPEYFDRGYEWWLLREAKRRNPNLYLDVLQWGAPGWIGGAGTDRQKFYSQDNADFIAAFIHGAKKFHGVEIDFCGGWNETPRDNAWIKLLRRTLDQRGLAKVKVIAPDELASSNQWDIIKDLAADRELSDAIHGIGVHYPKTQSSPEAVQTGKPLWASEDGPWRGDWEGARWLARAFNRNYVVGRMTKTVIWSLVTSYYDVLQLPNSGPMMAKEPWSGHFELQPALWVVAHTCQFAQPGWKYLDSACVLLPAGGSCVALRRPDAGGDFSLILETTDAKAPQTLQFRVTGGLSPKPLHVWRSVERNQFEEQKQIRPANGVFTLTLAPDTIYSLTTTTGQRKGRAKNVASAPFPLPYADGFEKAMPGKFARYFSDQGGVFEVAARPEGRGQCLRQVVPRNGIDWNGHPTPEPYSLIGSPEWRNYEVSADALIEGAGSVSIFGRVVKSYQDAQPAKGYWLKVSADGAWSLHAFTSQLAGGRGPFRADQWHNLKLKFAGTSITAYVDGTEVKTINDTAYLRGMAALGTGWNCARFDNFTVRPLAGRELKKSEF